MSERASMPTFVPRTVASFERTATAVARRVAAPVRMLATRALSFADRLVGTWAGTGPMVGGIESGKQSTMQAAVRGGAMPLPRPWYQVDADEDTIWPQQAARAAMAAAARTAPTTRTAATAAVATTAVAAQPGDATTAGAAPVLPAAERGAAIARTNLTAPPERTAPPTTTSDEADAPIAADATATRVATASPTTTATPTADLRAAEALGLHVAPVQPIVAAAPVARATTPLARALAHAAWVDQQLRTTAPVAPVERASAGYVFIAPAEGAPATTERARPATTTVSTPSLAEARATERASIPAAATTTPAAPMTMASPSAAAWSPLLPDPRLAAAMPTAAQRVVDFVAQLAGAQAARDATPVAPVVTTTFAPTVAETTTTAMPRRAAAAERTFVVLPPPAVATVSWRPGAAAARVEQLGSRVDARVSAAWGEPAPTTMATASPVLAPIAAAAPATRAVPAAEQIYVAPSDVPARATGPARLSQFMQQLVGVQAARATAPLPVQALVAALARDAAATTTTSAAAATAATATAAASMRAPERVALAATLAARPATATATMTPGATATMTPGAMARRAEQLGGVVGVRAASLSIDFVDPARLSMLTGEAPAMTTLAPVAQPAASDTIMPAPRPLFATAVTAAPALTAEEWSLVTTFPSAATAVQLAAARQATPWSATTSRATQAPERTLLAAIAERATPASESRAAVRGGAPAEYVAPTVAPTETQARLPGGRAPRGSFTWPKIADYTPRAEWTAPPAVAAAEQAKQAAPGTPLWGVMQPLVALSPSLAPSSGATATGGASRAAADFVADATSAPSRELVSPAQSPTGGEPTPARGTARGDAPARTLMTAAATREARSAARMGTGDVVRVADTESAGEPQRTAPSMPMGGGEAVRAGGVSNVRPLPAMPLMTGGPAPRDGATAAGRAVGPSARALELARPFLRLVEGSVAGDAQRSSTGQRFFEQPQPMVSGAPASDSASRLVEALRSQPAGGGSSDDRVSLSDLTLIALASATQQVAASPEGGGPGGGGGAAAAPASSASAAPSSSHGSSGNPAQDIEELARAAFDELLRQISIANERKGRHG